MDELLKKFGLTYEDLTNAEKETLHSWTSALQQEQVTVDRVRVFIQQMKEGVEQELTTMNHNTIEDIFLKARLRNLMLLDSFMSTPDKAKQALEKAMASISVKK